MFKILVVEDDKELNRSVCTFLNQSSYEAAGCLNATDAYDAMYAAALRALTIKW
jgi:DNA-binding response OmpR family regulator